MTTDQPTATPLGRFHWLALTGMMAVYVALLGWGCYVHSPIADEPAYLASGISHWTAGHFELCKVSPPLVRLIAAIPVVAFSDADCSLEDVPISNQFRSEHIAGYRFAQLNGSKSFWYFTLARWACIPFAVLGATVCFVWARALFGIAAGFAALTLWCFSPAVLAHAQMMNADTGVTSLSVATGYFAWRWSQQMTPGRALVLGISLGLAILAKTNAVVLFPTLVIGSVCYRLLCRDLRLKTQIAHLSLALLASIYIINLGYGGVGSFQKLKDLRLGSQFFAGDHSAIGKYAFYGSFLDHVPVPLPAAFVEGIDLQKQDFENSNSGILTYLRGEWYDHSWWWYYFYVVAVKEPIAFGLLLFAAAIVLVFNRIPHRKDLVCFVVLPAATLFATACTQTGFGAGIRYVLPAFPFAFVLASGLFSTNLQWATRAISAVVLTTGALLSLSIYPHSLCYFNWFGGGPNQGHFHLIDSNMEWGQNLLFVKDWVDQHQHEEDIFVAQWSFYPVEPYGIEFREPEIRGGEPIPVGTYLISTNYLRGNRHMGKMELRRFLDWTPDERIGYTTYVYRVPKQHDEGADPGRAADSGGE